MMHPPMLLTDYINYNFLTLHPDYKITVNRQIH